MKKNAPKTREILYGIHPIREALAAGRRTFHCLYVVQDRPNQRLQELVDRAGRQGIPVQTLSRPALTKKCGTDLHQGISAQVGIYPLASLSEILDTKDGFLLMMDSIEDPQNLGALVRTALCAGALGIILPRDRAAAPNPTASKASAGALEHARICRVTNLSQTIQTLKEHGFWVIGTSADAPKSLFQTRPAFPLVLVIGSEGKGIRPLVQKHCDMLVSIPLRGPVASLNASAAGAVVMYELFRQSLENQTP